MGKRSTSRVDRLDDENTQDTYTVNDRMQADARAAGGDAPPDDGDSALYEEDVVIVDDADTDDEYDDDEDDDLVDENTDDPDAIRDDIEETRSQLGDTIDAIQEKLSPQRITRQVTDSVREATIGKAEEFMSDMSQRAQGLGASLGETLRENWVPAALIGVGVGWLLFRNGANRQQNRNPYYSGGYGYRGYDYPNYPNPSDYQARTYRTSSGNQGAVQQGMRKAGQAVNQAQSAVGDTMDTMQGKMGDAIDTVQETMGRVGDQAQYRAQQAQSWLADAYDDNPLMFGAVALAAGVAVAMAIPETQQEHEWMGPTRDSMLQQAESVTQDTLQKTQQVAKRAASAATDAAQDEAKKQQLTR